ncbi:hypothetical protein [Tenuifilum thalassicum]|uniref:LamG domain-containing protein n=1 Tax=Tenuifilum thalassicum TaxID=2590900 RepID=A0A7D4C771_9BACT|nr:hypothetical protein [Tenuifilum thalassicum]QKG78782.1 LamG domain-containing protein [Tenuifilum thalassicum]
MKGNIRLHSSLLTSMLLIFAINSYSQTGPGGVGNRDGSNGQPKNVIWFDASALGLNDNDPVATWTDMSGNGNDGVQLTASAQPIYRTGQINGMPAVIFDGTDDYIPFDGSTIVNSDYTVIVVTQRRSNRYRRVIIGGSTSASNQNLHVYWENSTNFRAHHYGNDLSTPMIPVTQPDSGGTDPNVYGIFSTLLSSGDATDNRRNYQNNTLLGTRTNSTKLSSYNGAAIARYGALNEYHDIDVAELIIFSNALSDAQLQIVHQYLNVKYDININNDYFDPDASYTHGVIGIGEELNGEHSEAGAAGFYLTALSGLNVGEYVFASHNNLVNNSANFRTDAEVTAAGAEAAYNRIWYVKPVGTPAAQIAFDFSEVLEDGLFPTNISNYCLLYRAGTTGNFTKVKNADGIKNGDQLFFSLTEAELKEGYYTLGTEDNTNTPLRGAPNKTWYTLISGNWGDWEIWTLDPSGALPNNPDHLTPDKSPTASFDNVVILTGRTVVVDTINNLQHSSIKVDGRLDLTTTTGHSFSTISGSGRILLAADNFPTGDATNFVTKSLGEGTVVYYGGSYDLTTAREFFDVEVELSNSSNTITLLNNYTINGDLRINTGTLKINDDVSTTILNLTVKGDVSVQSTASIVTGLGDTRSAYQIGGTMPADDGKNYHDIFHQFYIYGDFNNYGVVRFTNLNAPDYDSFADNGAVTVRFMGASNAEMNLYNTTDFYNLIIDKGTDKTYKVKVYSDNNSYFRLFGPNSCGRTTGAPFSAENPQVRKALWIYHGTLQLTGNIDIPTLSEGGLAGGNGDYAIGKSARLWIDGNSVTVYSTASSVDQVTGFTSSDPNPADGVNTGSSNQAMSVYGEFKITKGFFGTRNSAGFIFWAASNAQLKIEGGTCYVAQVRSAGGGGGIASYVQTGGTMQVFGNEASYGGEYTSAYPLFGLEGTDAVFQMSGGIILLQDDDATNMPEFSINSAEGNYQVTGGSINFQLQDGRSAQIQSTANLWNLTLNNSSGTGTVVYQLDTNLVVSNDLTLNPNIELDVEDPTVTGLYHDVSIGRNFSIYEGATYTYGQNTTTFNGTQDGTFYIGHNTDDGYEQYLWNLTVNKSAGRRITITGDPNKDPDNVSAEWHNRLVHVVNDANIESGILDQGRQSIRLFAGVYVKKNGQLGTYEHGTTPTSAYVMFRDGDLTINSEKGATFGNIKFNSTGTVTFTSDIYIKRIGFYQGLYNIQKYNLKVDYFHNLATTNNIAVSNGSVSEMIYTSGNASDGGVSILVNSNGTYSFPIGVSGKYTPAQVDVTNFSDSGYVKIVPVNHYLYTLTGGSSNVLQYYWKVDEEDFNTLPNVYWTFFYDQADVDGNETSYRSARIINYKTVENLGNWSVDRNNNEIYFADDATQNPIPLKPGDYTAGNPSVFNATVRTLYARKNGVWHDYTTWSTTPDGNTPLNNKNQLPTYGDIVVIGEAASHGDENKNYSVAIDNTHPDYAPINIAMLCILRYGTGESSLVTVGQNGADCNFGVVTNRDPDATNPDTSINHASKIIVSGPVLPNGDFGEFLTAPYTIFTFSRAFPGTNATIDDGLGGTLSNNYYASYKIGNSITEYPILQFEYDGYSGGYIELPDVDITVHSDLRMFKGDHHLKFGNSTNGNLTVEGDFEFNDGSSYNIEFQASGVERVLTINGDINFNNQTNSQFSVENAASSLVHKIKLQGSVINPSTTSSFNCFNGSGNAAASLEFIGSANSTFNDMITIPDFYQLIMNKGTNQTYVATINTELNLGSDASSTSDLKPIQLLNGTLQLNHPTGNIDISTGGENFEIPSTACLQITQGTANVYGDNTGIRLDGKILIDGGTLDMISGAGNGNNYIEYSASGNAQIEISSGNLWVGSQIRRSLNSEEGILKFNQSGGEVLLGVNSGGDNDRAIFEILNNGSSFSNTGGDFYLVNDYRTAPTIASMYFDPQILSLSSGSTVHFGHTSTVAGNADFTLYAGRALRNIQVNSTNSPSLTLDVVPLTLYGNLTINSGATFDANGLDLNIYGNFTNNGTFIANYNSTYFKGSVDQQITGQTTFYNLYKTTSNKLSINDDIDVDNDLGLNAGSFFDNGNTLSVQGDVNMDITTTWGGIGDGILMNGSTQQVLTGNGTFGKLSINNISGVVLPIGNEFTIEDVLQLESGVFDIDKNLLTLNANAIIVEKNPFSDHNMIQTNISFTDAGVKKIFPSIVPADNYGFIYPLGSEGRFTPVEFDIDNVDAGGYIRVTAAHERHPTIVNDSEPCQEIVDTANVLNYHWLLDANGISNFTANARMKYDEGDFQLNNPYYDVTHYIAARLLLNTTLWNKFDPASFDEANSQLLFSFVGTDDNGVSGDYTAGVEDQNGTCEGAIPDEVPIYITKQNGPWTDANTWDTYPTSGGTVPAGGPRGAVVIIEHEVTTPPVNYILNYKTIINSTGVIKIGTTYGHRLGIVEGTGKIQLERGDLPAGIYDDFFGRSGGTLEFTGSSDYDVLSEITHVRNLIFSGTGQRRLPNLDLEIYGQLTIDGSDNNLWVRNEHYRDLTLDSNIVFNQGQFYAGIDPSKVIFNGSYPQTITGTGSFTGSNSFLNVDLDNSTGLTLDSPVEIKGSLNLISGIITTDNINILTINNASETAVTGYSSSNYIDGPMQKLVSTGGDYLFPVGDAGRYGPVSIFNASNSSAAYWKAEYFNSATPNNASLAGNLQAVSSDEYWEITNPNAGDQAQVQLRWDSNSEITPVVTGNINDIVVAEFNGTNWVDKISTATGGSYSGTVKTSSNINVDPKQYTLGSKVLITAKAYFTTLDPACQGSSIPVSFAGIIDPDNMYLTLSYEIDGVPQTDITVNSLPYSLPATIAGSYVLTGLKYNSDAKTGVVDNGSVTVNPAPSIFNVTGGGQYCEGGAGVPVNLDGSESGVTYTLYRDGNPTATSLSGTGAALSFGNQTVPGSYTVVATNSTTGCSQTMAGNANVTMNPNPVFSISGSASAICDGDNFTLTTTFTTVSTPYDIDIIKDGSSVTGSPFNSSSNPYVYSENLPWSGPDPSNSFTYTVTVTDNKGCSSSSSSPVTVNVYKIPETGPEYHIPNNFAF